MAQKRARNRTGSTYKVGNSWKTVIRTGGRTISATASTKTESQQRAAARLAQSSVLPEDQRYLATTITVPQYVEQWLERQYPDHLAHSTYRRYTGLLNLYIRPALKSVRIGDLRTRDIETLLSSMATTGHTTQTRRTGVGTRSRAQVRILLSVSMNDAVRSGLITHNPVVGIPAPRSSEPLHMPLSDHEVSSLLTNALGTFMHARLAVACLAGLRQGEALGLRWSDIDLKAGVIHVRTQIQKVDGQHVFTGLKTRASKRSVPMSQILRDSLTEHRALVTDLRTRAGEKWVDHDLVFPNRHGGPQQSKGDYARWQRALATAGLAARPLHQARHTCATLLAEAGVDIETIRRFLGHSSIVVTSSVYVGAITKPLETAASRLDDVLNAA